MCTACRKTRIRRVVTRPDRFQPHGPRVPPPRPTNLCEDFDQQNTADDGADEQREAQPDYDAELKEAQPEDEADERI